MFRDVHGTSLAVQYWEWVKNQAIEKSNDLDQALLESLQHRSSTGRACRWHAHADRIPIRRRRATGAGHAPQLTAAVVKFTIDTNVRKTTFTVTPADPDAALRYKVYVNNDAGCAVDDRAISRARSIPSRRVRSCSSFLPTPATAWKPGPVRGVGRAHALSPGSSPLKSRVHDRPGVAGCGRSGSPTLAFSLPIAEILLAHESVLLSRIALFTVRQGRRRHRRHRRALRRHGRGPGGRRRRGRPGRPQRRQGQGPPRHDRRRRRHGVVPLRRGDQQGRDAGPARRGARAQRPGRCRGQRRGHQLRHAVLRHQRGGVRPHPATST